jgi:hypothetical protein
MCVIFHIAYTFLAGETGARAGAAEHGVSGLF